MTGSRIPRFESHIRPMFRRIDRDHMLVTSHPMDLWDYDDVVAAAGGILSRLQTNMPPVSTGGLWPEEWIQLFKRWIDEGCPRLELAEAAYRIESITATIWKITATVRNPGPGYVAWLERPQTQTAAHEFLLYREFVNGGTSDTFDISEFIEDPSGAGTVVIVDSTGTHQITFL